MKLRAGRSAEKSFVLELACVLCIRHVAFEKFFDQWVTRLLQLPHLLIAELKEDEPNDKGVCSYLSLQFGQANRSRHWVSSRIVSRVASMRVTRPCLRYHGGVATLRTRGGLFGEVS